MRERRYPDAIATGVRPIGFWRVLPALHGSCTQFMDEHENFLFYVDGTLTAEQADNIVRAARCGFDLGRRDKAAEFRNVLEDR